MPCDPIHNFSPFMPRSRGVSKSFTLLELLIVIGIIAVLGSVTFIALNPVETLRASRDTQRFSDLDALNKSINMAVIENTSASLGTASTVYVSLSDASATCASWSLPTLPTGWAYHCAASSTYTMTDGTGWLPVNLAALSTGSPVSHDPLDPTNDQNHYYQYVPNPNATTWELASVMESSKYKMGGPNDKTSTDGGQNLGLYEKGTDLTLVPVDSGDTSLVGWWPLNEGSGTVAIDRSGKGNNGNWAGTPAGDNGTYYTTSNGKTVGKFDGSDDFIDNGTNSILGTHPFTLSSWIQNNASTTYMLALYVGDASSGKAAWLGYCYNAQAGVANTLGGGFYGTNYGSGIAANNTWHLVTLSFNGSVVNLYSDGILKVASSFSPNLVNNSVILGKANTGAPYYFD